MSITTKFISSAFGNDIGSVFTANPNTSVYTPPADTDFIANGSDLSQQLLSIKYAPGTSTNSGFIATNGDDLSKIFATGQPLTLSISNFSSNCSYQTTSGETCCPNGGGSGSVSVTASGGYSPYTYSWVVTGQSVDGVSQDWATFTSTTSDYYFFKFSCLSKGKHAATGTITVNDSNGNSVQGTWYADMTVTSIS